MKIRKELVLDIMVAIRNQVFFAEQNNKKQITLSKLIDEINRVHYYIRPRQDHKIEYKFALLAIEREGYIKIEDETVYFTRYIFS